MIVHIPLQLTLANKLYLSSKLSMEPLIVSKRCKFGLVLYAQLEKHIPDVIPKMDRSIDMSKFDERVDIQISEKIYLMRGVYLSNRAVMDFNFFVREMMMDEFYAYMDFHFRLNRVQLRQCIMDWMLRSNLYEDALALRTLEKAYERYRKAEERNIEHKIFA